MLQNAYFLAKIGADTAENERNFAENLLKSWQLPYGTVGCRDPTTLRVPSVVTPGARARCPCFGASVLKFSYLCGVYIITDAFFDSKTSLNGSETDLPEVNSRFAFHFEFAKF